MGNQEFDQAKFELDLFYDKPHITVEEVQEVFKQDGLIMTTEQAIRVQIFLHRLAKITLHQILEEG